MIITTFRGMHEAQQGMTKTLAAFQGNGALSKAVHLGVTLALSRALIKTHVRTGALRLSHRGEMETPLRGRVFIGQNVPGISFSTSARGRRRRVGNGAAAPAQYGPYEHARGGTHAFYARVVQEDGDAISRNMANEFVKGLPR